jgi:hypothetical protein
MADLARCGLEGAMAAADAERVEHARAATVFAGSLAPFGRGVVDEDGGACSEHVGVRQQRTAGSNIEVIHELQRVRRPQFDSAARSLTESQRRLDEANAVRDAAAEAWRPLQRLLADCEEVLQPRYGWTP